MYIPIYIYIHISTHPTWGLDILGPIFLRKNTRTGARLTSDGIVGDTMKGQSDSAPSNTEWLRMRQVWS